MRPLNSLLFTLILAPTPRVTGVILGAGRSTRMGGRSKLLTPIGDEPAVSRIARELRTGGVDDITIVAPASVQLPTLDARVVHNPDPDAGRTGSLQLGLSATPLTPDATVILWPVDHPLARAATVRALLKAQGEWVLPTHLGRSGHPILVRGERALGAIQRAAPSTPLRGIPPTLGIIPARVAVNDAGILANLDTPEDLRHVSSRSSGQSL